MVQITNYKDDMGLFDVFKRGSSEQTANNPLMDSLKSAGFDIDGIEVKNEDGVAVLSGKLENGQAIDSMVNFLRRSPGINKVVNQIKVKDVSDQNIRYRVETKANFLNVRKGPSTDFQIKGKIPNGEEVVLIKKANDNWLKVRSNDLEGYCNSDYLKPL